jgi:SOS-response transcriptional repressor LexA/predicted transcriptional regulator
MAGLKKFGGPPKRETKLGERVALSLRLTPDLKRRLDAAAEGGGRSQSQEAEIRLASTFDREDLLPDLLRASFGSTTGGHLMAIGLLMTNAGLREYWSRSAGLAADENWPNDPTAFDQAVQAVFEWLNRARPPGEVLGSQISPGVLFANDLITSLGRTPTKGDRLAGHYTAIQTLLGPIAKRMAATVPRKQVRPTEERRVPLLTLTQAMELSAFKTWDSARFANATSIAPRFACGPRSFAIEVPNSDEDVSLLEGDVLILDPDVGPAVGDWVLAQIDGSPRLAVLLTEKVRDHAPVLLTHNSQQKHYLGGDGGPSVRAVMTELCSRRRYAQFAAESSRHTEQLDEAHFEARKKPAPGSRT